MSPDQNMALNAPTASLNGSAPRCAHRDGLVPVAPQSDHCRDCQACGGHWESLVVCLTCGWVACSDDSPHHHARAHYQETDHPVARGLEPVTQRPWCYVHRRLV